MKRRIRTYHQVAEPGAENIIAQVTEQADRLAGRLAAVRRIVVVASGKGGVGKSALTANLAAALASGGQRVGAADADLNGPSLARMLGAHRHMLAASSDGIAPAEGAAGVHVMSMDLLLSADDAPLRWKAPDAPDFLWQSTLEGGVLREFLADVQWGELDTLLIDAPPGTDKITRLLQLLPRVDALLLVTTPSEIARFIVAKSARLARDSGVQRIGLVINMSGHVCEACGHHSPLFEGDVVISTVTDDVGISVEMDARAGLIQGVETWAEVPFDRRLALTTDRGVPFVLAHPQTPAARAIRKLGARLRAVDSGPAS
jgi:ATP-binding protein involved in chromosome partitioning